MSDQPTAGAGPPEIIYVIRHGEKPADPQAVGSTQPPSVPGPPYGVDDQGNQNSHSLLPKGWQRSGALAALFDPAAGAPQAGLQTPASLFSPSYGDPVKTSVHRTYQTIQGLGDRLGVAIASPLTEDYEPELAARVVSGYSGVVLICWEHHRIPAIALSLPAVPGTVIPRKWPDDRFDVIWTFTLAPGDPAQYSFGQVPQQLLSGDSDTIIPA